MIPQTLATLASKKLLGVNNIIATPAPILSTTVCQLLVTTAVTNTMPLLEIISINKHFPLQLTLHVVVPGGLYPLVINMKLLNQKFLDHTIKTLQSFCTSCSDTTVACTIRLADLKFSYIPSQYVIRLNFIGSLQNMCIDLPAEDTINKLQLLSIRLCQLVSTKV